MIKLDFDTFYNSLKKAIHWGTDRDLNEGQLKVVKHGEGPLLIIAGPGSGKTEVLVWRCLKLLLVDGIDPKSIFFTSFTEKAARNLIDRITNYITLLMEELGYKIEEFPDPSLIHIGTLHSLCNEIMQEYRYINYQNKRLMEDFEQRFFVYRYCRISNSDKSRYKPGPSRGFWQHFELSSYDYGSKWGRVNNGIYILNRIIEDDIDLEKLEEASSSNEIVKELLYYYNDYKNQLDENYRCDFAHLQKYFLDFLGTAQGKSFLEGDKENNLTGIKYILVDEYQDTNPIQEEIYFKLAENTTNLTIVGDDDQAMYRFRGASVDALVDFKERCEEILRKEPVVIQLKNNYRSHEKIITNFNNFVLKYEEFNLDGVRAPGKEAMICGLKFENDWNPILCLQGRDVPNLAKTVVNCLEYIRDNNLINDLSQIVLLFRSTREGIRGSGHFVEVLNNRGIPYFNPRSRMVQESQEIKKILGAILELIDPPANGELIGKYQGAPLPGMRLYSETEKFVNECRQEYQKLDVEELTNYIENSRNEIKNYEYNKGIRAITILSVFYRIINLPPFSGYLQDSIIGPRIGILSQLLEAYSSTNNARFIRASEDSSKKGFGLKRNIIGNFYVPFCQLLVSQGLNDFEDKEFPIPKGYIQIMTYHQAKGLEFPYVFLLDLTKSPRIGLEHVLEDFFNNYRKNPINLQSRSNRALFDHIRIMYVGRSRAQNGLILSFTSGLKLAAMGYDENGNDLSVLLNLKKKYIIEKGDGFKNG